MTRSGRVGWLLEVVNLMAHITNERPRDLILRAVFEVHSSVLFEWSECMFAWVSLPELRRSVSFSAEQPGSGTPSKPIAEGPRPDQGSWLNTII